jgi:hypothetical protein
MLTVMFPELGHEAWVRIARQTLAWSREFATEVIEIVFA